MHPASDEAWMRAALALARRGLGRTAPMPSVAAMVIDERHDPPLVLGRGRTSPGGRPHAEANALDQAGAAARGATMVVTLEPCARRSQRVYGPSCTERILEAGIARVVIAAADPSPFAAGEGVARLEQAGILVVHGVLAAEARKLTLGHALRITENRPEIIVKLAQTADGFAATADRRPLAITGEATRAAVHRLRASVDAIVTGIGTVLADNPRLDVRLPGLARQSPLRVVLDSDGRMPEGAAMLATAGANPVLVATAEPTALAARLGETPGLEIMPMPRDVAGGLDLAALFAALAARGITRVLVEAGPTLAAACAAAGFIDELLLFTSPQRIGAGLPALPPPLALWRDAAACTEERAFGPDLRRRYLRRE